MTEEEKVIAFKKEGLEYLNCCDVGGKLVELTKWDIFLNQILSSKNYIAINRYEMRIKNENYYWRQTSVDSCGNKGNSKVGTDISKSNYEAIINKNKKDWEKTRNG